MNARADSLRIPSKSTKYNGYNFRSRLEARWAVFFDALGIKYHYEYRDFLLPSGKRYLPDFFLPNFYPLSDCIEGTRGIYAEIKHVFDEKSKDKCRQLCEMTHTDCLMLESVPDFKIFEAFCYTEDGCFAEHNDGHKNFLPDWISTGYSVKTYRGVMCAFEYRDSNSTIFWEPGYDGLDIPISDFIGLGERFINAVFESRAKRFEF